MISGSMLDVEEVHTYYGESHILQGVSLNIEQGENVALIGRNGVGKTTTLRSILQLTPPRSGSIRYAGEEITGKATHEVAAKGIGWIPEDRRIFDHLTVAENIKAATPEATDSDKAYDLVYDVFPDLQELQGKEGGSLSGGQQQMLAIARGLVGENELLLIDEPSEGLAPMIVERVVEALSEIAKEKTILLVEQNFSMAMDLTDRYYLLDNGEVVGTGDSDAVSRDDEIIQKHLLTA